MIIIKIKNFLILLVINGLIFQSLLQNYFSFFQVFDELIAMFFGIYYIISIRWKIKKHQLTIVVISLLMIILGILGNIRFAYQTNIAAILLDVFCFFKYIITFLGAMEFFKKYDNFDKILKTQNSIIKIITLITFCFCILNFLIGINGMTYEIRYGIRAFQFIYGHAGSLNVITTYFCIFLIYQLFQTNYKSKSKLYLILNIIILISTLRTRAFVVVGLIVLLLYLYYFKGNQKVNKFLLAIIIMALTFFVSYSQVDKYFIASDRSPRSDLLKGGIQLMVESFPTGTGYATFGSFAASKYYSILYYRFGFHNNYGMNPYDTQFLTDNFWPIVFAEYGFLGIILYIILLLLLFKIIWHYSNSNFKKTVSLLIILTMLFNSTVSSAFVHYSAVTYMFIIAFFLNYKSSSLNK